MHPSRFLKAGKWLCLLFLCSFSVARLSGQIAVELEKENVLVVGLTNPISVVVNGVRYACLVLRPSGGLLEQQDSLGHYEWSQIPDTNFLTLEIIDTCKNELVTERNYRVRDIQVQVLLGGQLQGRFLTVDRFKMQRGISAALSDEVEGKAAMIGFFAEFYSKKTGELWTGFNSSELFTGSVAEKCQSVEPGDWVRFYDISYKIPGRKKPTISTTDLFFRIK